MKETTANRLKQIMNEKGLRQVDVVRLCAPYCSQYNLRLSKSDLSQFVNGKVTPGQWKISILSHALNVNEAWLMGYDVPRERATAEQVQFVHDVFEYHVKDTTDKLVLLLSDLPPKMVDDLLDLVSLPPEDLQRVFGYAQALREEHKD